MLVKFTDTDLYGGNSVYVEVDLVRLVIQSQMTPNPYTIIYQQDSDSPIRVREDIEEVVRKINEAKGKSGSEG